MDYSGLEGMAMEAAVSTAKIDPKRRALGKGLESLLPSRPAAGQVNAVQGKAEEQKAAEMPAPVEVVTGKPMEIELGLIDRNPYQTRTTMDREKLLELAASIAASGVVQPIVVRALPEGRYQLITGERRWLASFEAAKTHIPAILREVSDEQAMEMTIVENLQRADLNPMEQARAYKRLAEEFKMNQADMAVRTGLARSVVANYLRLTKLPEVVQTNVESGALTFGHAKLLMALEGYLTIEKAARRVLALSMSVRQTETYVQGLLNPELKQKAVKAEKEVDANVKDMQDQLQRALGMRVQVEDKKGRGKVIIEYKGVDDFETILEAMGIRR